MSSIVFIAAEWVIITPFGFPVEPDVNMMYAKSGGPSSEGVFEVTLDRSEATMHQPISTLEPREGSFPPRPRPHPAIGKHELGLERGSRGSIGK